VRIRFPAAKDDWWIEISDGTATLAAILPAMVLGASTRKRASCR